MISIIERNQPNGVTAGRALVVGELGEPVLPPPRSSRPDTGLSERLPAVTVGIVGLGYVGLPTPIPCRGGRARPGMRRR